ncbi:YceD family protein [Cognatishimia maritima]|uniref:Uncharacterized metal-binding protein YceD, DUF177 family n=1 Tax=Cognatishimia maritima TaxID=870908 RepID=A0A1M5IXQ9_9RHOB|nr:DUF177 domain-containing protein [Cognatishimia maritima]SHG32543.1 Uncharacterized metal-binding protein YceD, DUF177 family [Cognatishimia maritima]
MSEMSNSKHVYRVADLPQNQKTSFLITADDEDLRLLAEDVAVTAFKKLRFEGTIAALGKRDWQLNADLGFTVVQPCIVSLDPVTTRVDVPVYRQFLANYEAPQDEEYELTEEENTEALSAEINVLDVLREALALALPLYPRKEGVSLAQTNFTEPGKKAMTDEDARPFAGLESLRDKLAGKDEK